MPAFMPLILGGVLAWNLLTDWVWIGNALSFLPSNYQKDLQARVRAIVDTVNAAKSIVIGASVDKRSLTSPEIALIRQNTDAVEVQINELYDFYSKKFIAYGAAETIKGLSDTVTTLRLQLADLKQTAGITSRTAIAAAKVEATVIGVHDGDTATLDNKEVVRLVGIDAPESTTEAGQASKRFLSSLVLGKKVTVESDPTKLKDMYGRRLGVITLAGVNINVEMLKKAYAIFYPYEPNSLVYDKVWKAAAEEGKAVMVTGPLADLKATRTFSYEKLRLWKSDERATQKATIDEEKERLRSEAKETLETLADDYAIAKETLKAKHAEILTEITELYRAKSIGLEEKARRRSAENTRYLETKARASAAYREMKSGISDPHKTEKAALTKLLQTKYKEINNTYLATKKEISEHYTANVNAVKLRMKLPYATEPELPTSVAPPVYIPPELPVVAPPVVAPPVVTAPVVTVTLPLPPTPQPTSAIVKDTENQSRAKAQTLYSADSLLIGKPEWAGTIFKNAATYLADAYVRYAGNQESWFFDELYRLASGLPPTTPTLAPVVPAPVVPAPVVPAPSAYPKIVTAGPSGIKFRNGAGTQFSVRYSVAAGPKFSAIGVTTGETVEGENRWWKISDGTFAWVGATIEKP